MKKGRISKLDIIVVIIILTIAFLGIFFMNKFTPESKKVQIYLDGKIYKTISLKSDKEVKINDENIVVIKDGKASMKYSSCTDQKCVKSEAISNVDETIACEQNKIRIEIIQGETIEDVAW